jgi:lipoprotein-anchoring transpeptidase ErfK/SrfK
MNNKFVEAREYVAKAREALRHNDHPSARQLGEQAAVLAPEMEDAWLVLAASDPDPQDALAYAQKALELNPESMRARRGVEWASSKLKQAEAAKERIPISSNVEAHRSEAISSPPTNHTYQTAVAVPQLKSQGRNWVLPVLLIGAGCILFGFIAFFALTSPVLASIVSSVSAPPSATQENLWAPVEIAKPFVTPIDVSAFAQQRADTPTSIPTDAPTIEQTPTGIPTDAPTASQTPAATETPGVMAMEIVADTPTSEYVAPTSSGPQVASGGNGVRWIDVDLSDQMVYAYEGDTIVNSFIVSTGTSLTPTVTGRFKVYIRLRSGSMRGPGYFLPDVPYIMYFHKSYGLHGTYWHNNFGTPMSHGCVNLRIDDAAWLYNWSYMGTEVNVHY